MDYLLLFIFSRTAGTLLTARKSLLKVKRCLYAFTEGLNEVEKRVG